jgi:dTDP-glucose 4,6-dehydratase
MKHKGSWRKLQHVASDRLRVVEMDLTQDELGVRLCQRVVRPDIIFSVASDSHVDRSIAYPGRTWLNNTKLIYELLEFARWARPRLFLQCSTDEVYGPAPAGESHAEWAPIIPSNPYSASKAAQEALCVAYWRTFGVPVVLTNTMNMIGERQDVEKYLPKVIRKVLRGETLEVHGCHETGRIGSRVYTHARNYADALVFLAGREPSSYDRALDNRPDRWNVVGEQEIDNLKLARWVAGVLGRPLAHRVVDFHATRPGHDMRYALDGRKLADAGWTPPVRLEDAVERTVRWFANNPDWLEERP